MLWQTSMLQIFSSFLKGFKSPNQLTSQDMGTSQGAGGKGGLGDRGLLWR